MVAQGRASGSIGPEGIPAPRIEHAGGELDARPSKGILPEEHSSAPPLVVLGIAHEDDFIDRIGPKILDPDIARELIVADRDERIGHQDFQGEHVVVKLHKLVKVDDDRPFRLICPPKRLDEELITDDHPLERCPGNRQVFPLDGRLQPIVIPHSGVLAPVVRKPGIPRGKQTGAAPPAAFEANLCELVRGPALSALGVRIIDVDVETEGKHEGKHCDTEVVHGVINTAIYEGLRCAHTCIAKKEPS